MTRIGMSRWGAAGLAFLIVIGSGSAIDALAEGGYKAPPVGFQITWSQTTREGGKVTRGKLTHSVVAVHGDEVVYRVEEPDGDRVHLLRGIFSHAFWRPGTGWAEYKFDKAAFRALWPLKPGKQARVKMEYGYGLAKTEAEGKKKWTRTETGSIHYTVLRREKVTTPAGTFDAVVIQRDRKFTKLDDKKVIASRRIGWLAPSIGYIVKQVVIYQPDNPKGRQLTLEAVSIKRPSK